MAPTIQLEEEGKMDKLLLPLESKSKIIQRTDLTRSLSQTIEFHDAIESDSDLASIPSSLQLPSMEEEDGEKEGSLNEEELNHARFIRRKYGLSSTSIAQSSRNEASLLVSKVEETVDRLLDLLAIQPITPISIDEDHPLAQTLLVLLEMVLQHGYASNRSLYLALLRSKDLSVDQNMEALLSNQKRKVWKQEFLWLRLALLSKSFTGTLGKVLPFLNEYYEEWAVLRSDQAGTLLASLSRLDPAVDFTFCLKTSNSAGRTPTKSLFAGSTYSANWKELFASDEMLCLDVLSPKLPFLALSSSNEETTLLRKQLAAQISQRVYFQEEHSRAQTKVSSLTRDLQAAHHQNDILSRTIVKLRESIEAHEATNMQLQLQLSLHSQNDRLNEEENFKLRLEEREKQIEDLRSSWEQERRLMQDQLLIANSIKDEYKRRLNLMTSKSDTSQ